MPLFTTETAALFIPFTAQELSQKNGICYGINAVSHNLILYNRMSSNNANGLILGTSGSGKSFAAKREIFNVILNTNDDVFIIDPEREYAPLAKALGGEIVRIAAGASTHINPFDMDIESGEGGGIYFEGENGVRLGVMLNRKRQRLEFGFINEGWGPNMLICNDVIQKFPFAEHSKVKILARKWFIEVYIDDIYVSSWRPTQQIDPNRYGFYLEDCTGKISNFEIWEMV